MVSREFPGKREPHQATFNRQQAAALARLCEIKVVSPRPWFPFVKRKPYRRLFPLCEREVWDGIEVFYPKYLSIPFLGRCLHPFFIALAVRTTCAALRREFAFDVVYANPLIPDACAAERICQRIGVPLVAAALGTDVNLGIRSALGRRRLAGVLSGASAAVAVSKDLKKKLESLGAVASIEVVYDGVDRSRFFPREKVACRKALKLPSDGKVVIFVGNLLRTKGVGVLLEALRKMSLPELTAVFVGDGPMAETVRKAAYDGQGCRIAYAGQRPHDEIPLWMGAADALCLPSFSEGVPNVALEAMACGRPVVASRVGGIPEVVREGATGILVPAGDADALAKALTEALSRLWDADRISSSASCFSWEENARVVHDILRSAVCGRQKNADIVALSKEWSGDWTSNHHLMVEFSRTRKVLWVNSIGMRSPDVRAGQDLGRIVRKLKEHLAGARQVLPNLFVFTPVAWRFCSPLVLRRAGEAYLRWSVRRAARRVGIRNFDLWTFLPNTAHLVGMLGERHCLYYCTDLFRGFAYLDGERICREESELVAKVDRVIATSDFLYADKKRRNPRTSLVRHGVSEIFFADRGGSPPPELAGLRTPLLGFYGWIRETVDLNLLESVAQAFPRATVVLIGKVSTDVSQLLALPNICFLGQKPYRLLPQYAAWFDVGLIPYRMSPELMEATNPVKLKEYFALGLPVVSTDLAEVRRYRQFCWIANDTESFIEGIRQALGPKGRERGAAARKQMRSETWDKKADEIRRILGEDE